MNFPHAHENTGNIFLPKVALKAGGTCYSELKSRENEKRRARPPAAPFVFKGSMSTPEPWELEQELAQLIRQSAPEIVKNWQALTRSAAPTMATTARTNRSPHSCAGN